MNKEDILAMSRKDNDKKDPYEMEIASKGNHIASAGMAIVVFILYVSNIFFKGEQDYGLWSIMAISMAVRYLYTGIRLKKRDQVILGVCWCVIFVLSFFVGMYKIIKR